MPHSSYLSTYRLDGYSPRLHLSVYRPAVACSGTLSATPSNPTTTLAVSYAVGSSSDVKAGFLIRIRDTATQKVKGYTRVRYTGTPGATIPVRELSFAHVACVSGDTFEVLRYVPLDTKLTTADATFSPDGIAYSVEGVEPPPLVCSGGNSVGWVDSGDTIRTITTDGSNTSLVAPDSVTPPTHFWINDSGTAFASGSVNSDASPVLEADVGSWLVQHNSSDPDTTRVGTQYSHHIVHDSTHLPYECILTDYSGDHESGVNWSVEVLDEGVTSEDIFELALCFLWVDDAFAQTAGNTDLHRSEVGGRSRIIGMGYARRVTTSMSGEDGVAHLTFDIQSPLARLSEIASYSKVMLENASPDNWNEVKTLGFRRGITQLWQFYTTGTESGHDLVYDASFDDARYPAHFLQRSDPIAQMRELIDARQGRLVQREWGARFEVQYHPAWLPLADRSSTDITLTSDDVYDYEFSTELADSIELFELQGITAGATGNTAVFSRIGVGGGKNADTVQRKAPDSQTQANEWAGYVYAARENIYQDEDGIKHRVGELTLRCPGQYAVLDFAPDYVAFNFADDYVDFSAFRCWLKRFTWDVDADSGEAMTTFTFQCETAARAGVTYVPPAGDGTPGDGQPPPFPFPPTSPVNPFPLGSGRYIIIDTNGYLYYTATGNSPTPVWAAINLSPTGTPLDFAPYAFSPFYLTGSGDLYLYLATSTRAARVTFTPSALSASLSNQASYTAVNYARVETERGTPGLVSILLGTATISTAVITTTDGATWGSPVTINANGASWEASGLYVSGRAAGKIFTAESSSTSISANGKVSTNSGVSFSTLSSPNLATTGGQGGAFGLHIPWHNNSAETMAYFGYSDRYAFHDGTVKLYRVSGATQTDISPTDGSTLGAQFPRSIDTAPNNRLRAAFVLRGGTVAAGDSSDLVNVYSSLDGGTTMTTYSLLNSTVGAGFYKFVRVLGDGSGFLAGGTAARLSACDFAGNSRDISGNLAALGCGTILNIAGW